MRGGGGVSWRGGEEEGRGGERRRGDETAGEEETMALGRRRKEGEGEEGGDEEKAAASWSLPGRAEEEEELALPKPKPEPCEEGNSVSSMYLRMSRGKDQRQWPRRLLQHSSQSTGGAGGESRRGKQGREVGDGRRGRGREET
eukprot:768396-Hanusia_phi.AAC.4